MAPKVVAELSNCLGSLCSDFAIFHYSVKLCWDFAKFHCLATSDFVAICFGFSSIFDLLLIVAVSTVLFIPFGCTDVSIFISVLLAGFSAILTFLSLFFVVWATVNIVPNNINAVAVINFFIILYF